uniref:RING-type E3 ubiquitin transferase n=1 Tax=Trypanosoma congolense (strain IL3000) TaxID=1068625 RepID=G0UW19_TRYCI|nr:predicted zinc finger protein [Trypanosoma congolense IL3000]
MRPVFPFDFSNMGDGIDWENAIPPHITAQRNVERAARQNVAPRPSMLMNWPLPENMDPFLFLNRRTQEQSARARRATDPHGTGGTQRCRTRQDAGRASHASSHPNSRHTPAQSLNRSQMAGAGTEPFNMLYQMADEMMQTHRIAMSALDNLHRGGVSDVLDAFEALVSPLVTRRGVERGSWSPPTSHPEGPSSEFRQTTVVARSVNGEPPQVAVYHSHRPGPARSRHANGSGSDYDIITGHPRDHRGLISLPGNGGTHRGAITDRSDLPQRREPGEEWEIDDFSYNNLLNLDNNAVSTGLPDAQLRGLDTEPYSVYARRKKGKRTSGTNNGGDNCAVCLEQFSSDDKVHEIKCGHVFHCNCIRHWLSLNNRCPTCRYEVPRFGRR